MRKRALASAILLANLLPVTAYAADRPPQFVAMAFDNCTELTRWQELTDFASEMNKDADRVHFTFFVSGINFIADQSRNVYEAPGQPRGLSRINFGGPAQDIRRRIDYVNDLYRRGHEIASHAVGHFNGKTWSAVDWAKEFRSFDNVLKNVSSNNGLPQSVALAFSPKKIAGFRAPYLATSPGLYAVLRDNYFRYDASGDGHADEWPEKIDGLWRFNLAKLKIHQLNKAALSMDYNFFFIQSRARPDPRHFELFREQILQTYLDYFKANYAGNRAPLHIGHHFFDYQNGAYKQALMSFARAVCGLPEVRCVTYSALADFMDRQSAGTLEAYRKGDFPHAGEPAINLAGLSSQR